MHVYNAIEKYNISIKLNQLYIYIYNCIGRTILLNYIEPNTNFDF